MQKRNNHGGAREGAGRKPIEGGTKPITIRLSGEDLVVLLALANQGGESANAAAKRLLLNALRGERRQ